MKIQTTAQITALAIDDKSYDLADDQTIELEFSAIDTGGGFKDPILDFSFLVQNTDVGEWDDEQTRKITLTLRNPDKEDSEVMFSYEGTLKKRDRNTLEANGRLKEDQLPREVIGFVLQLLR